MAPQITFQIAYLCIRSQSVRLDATLNTHINCVSCCVPCKSSGV